MGDFNSVISDNLDKSATSTSHSGMPKTLKKWLASQQLVDIWRDQNKLVRVYTYYSGRHNSFSRIDYIFQRHDTDIKVDSVRIGSRTHSDHAPLLLRWQLSGEFGGFRMWKMDNSLLLNNDVEMGVRKEIECFFQFNGSTDDKVLLWETFKVFSRGILMSQKSYLSRKRQKLSEECKRKISILESRHKATPTQVIKQELNN